MSADGDAPRLPSPLRVAFERGGEMGRRMLELDWSASPVGPPAGWPSELRGAVTTMLASRAQIVIFWGPEYCSLYNDAYIAAMGSKHPAHLGRPGRELWAEAWSVLKILFDGVRTDGEAFWAADHPFMLERHGFLEETYFDISYDPIRSESGTVDGIFCIVSDTTGRVLGERRVRTLSALGSRLADSPDQAALAAEVSAVFAENEADVPYARLVLDEDGRAPEAVHPLVRQVIGTGQAASATLHEITDAPRTVADDALVLPVTVGTARVGALVVGLSRYLAPGGGYRDFLELATAQISRAVGNLRAYEQERGRAVELAVLDRAKTNFFSNVSHEFRTPLTLILGPLEDLLDDPALPARSRERLLPMHRNGLRLLKLVNTVLDFSRLESGRVRAAYQPTDLADYTARLASTFRSAVERAGLALVVEAPPLPGPVHVDREMWEKIVLNLLSNAVKYTPAGLIEVRVRATDRGAELIVRDTGIGIPPDQLPLLFDRFHRVTGVWSRSHEGTGIGLALVRELAELHGGSAGVESEPGAGSVFTVTVPFGTAHLPADRLVEGGDRIVAEIDARPYVEEAEHWWTGDEPPPLAPLPGANGRPRGRILLVDDNADLRDHLSRLLRPLWDVTTAVDGRAALDLAEQQTFDLVLTDVMMPRLDGFGLIAALRGDERTRDVPILVLTARAGEEASSEGLAAGADDYLVKPFSARDLTARVRSNLDLGQARRQVLSRLRGLVDTAAAVNTVRTTAEVLDVAAQHVRDMAAAGRVVITVPGARAEVDGGADPRDRPDVVLPLPDTSGATVGELRVWSSPQGTLEPAVLTQLARLIGLRLENARLYEAEHRIATTLQHSLLPQSLPPVPGAIVASRYLPGSSEAEVGGDWYDVIPRPDDQLFLVIGDVVGKGVQAAAGMGQLRNALRAYILEGFDCGAALTRLNRLVDNLGRRQFATVVCVRFDPRERRVHFSSAGHPPPVLVSPGELGSFLYSTALGPPIGALSDIEYPTLSADLPANARLLLYTDGLVEDRETGIDAGFAELTADVAKPAEHIEDLLDTLLAKAARRSRRDDIALLAMEVTEPREFVLRLAAEPTGLSVLRRRLEDFLTAGDVPEADIFDVIVAVSEAAANAVEHPIEPAEPVVTVEASLADDAVTVTVSDTGSWRPSIEGGFRGRGLALIGALTELSVVRSEQGTSVTLRRPLSR